MPSAQFSSPGESAEMLTLFHSDISTLLLREFPGYDPKRKHGNYMVGTFMLNARLDAWVVTVLRGLVESENRENIERESTATRTQKWWRFSQGN